MFDIILFSGIGRNTFDVKPIGIYKIASILRNAGYTVKTINFFESITNEQFKKIVDNYVSEKTKIVGLSATVLKNYTTNEYFGIPNDDLLKRIDYIRNKNSNIKFILGGAQISNTLDNILKSFETFDYIVKGQGEEAILHIVNHTYNRSKLITNTITKPFIVTDRTYTYSNFNTSPHTFHKDDNIQQGECLPLEIARGCIFKCKFCSYDLTNKKFDEFTKHENLLKNEILYNYENFKTKHYLIVDDLINDSEEKVDMLLRITESLPFEISMGGYARLDMLWRYPTMIDKMKKMGIKSVFFGIETTNDKSGKIVGKGLGLSRINQTLDMLYDKWQNQIHITASLIFGLPNDNQESVKEMSDWAIEKIKSKRIHIVTSQPLTIHPTLGKAEIDKNPEKFGYKITDLETSITKHRYSMSPANWETNTYSFEQAVSDSAELHKRSNMLSIGQVNAFNVPNILSFEDDSINLLYKNLLDHNNNKEIVGLIEKKFSRIKQQYLDSLLINTV